MFVQGSRAALGPWGVSRVSKPPVLGAASGFAIDRAPASVLPIYTDWQNNATHGYNQSDTNDSAHAGHLPIRRADVRRRPRPARTRSASASQAAEALFDRRGYANTTMEQIVRALGVTALHVYYYFHNKQEIFETLSAARQACFTVMDSPGRPPRCACESHRGHRAAGSAPPSNTTRRPSSRTTSLRSTGPSTWQCRKKLANHFCERLCALMEEEARADGMLDFKGNAPDRAGRLQPAGLSPLVPARRAPVATGGGARTHATGLARAGPAHGAPKAARSTPQPPTETSP